MNDSPSQLLTGKPVNLGDDFEYYGGNTGTSSNVDMSNFMWYQATPYSILSLEPYIIEIKQHAPSQIIDTSGNNRTFTLNRYFDYSYIYRANQYWYGYPYGYNDTYQIVNNRNSLEMGGIILTQLQTGLLL